VKVLVLGGTRFIGRRLVEALLEHGHRVTIFTRGTKLDPWGNRVSRITGDRKSAKDLARTAHAGKDAVFDLLCYDEEDARLALEAYSGRTAHFVHVSTCSVYWCTGDFPVPVPEEDFDRLDEFPERPGSIEYAYGYAKRMAERVFVAAGKERGFPATRIRMPIVGGEADPSTRYFAYFHKIRDGKPLVLPDGGRLRFRHCYVGDAAATMAALPGNGSAIGRAYNLACAEELTLAAIVEKSAKLMGIDGVETAGIPMKELDALGLDRAFSPFSQPAEQLPAIERARAELGYRPTPYDEWLERTVRWYVDYYRAGDPDAYAHRAKELQVLEAWRRIHGGEGAGA